MVTRLTHLVEVIVEVFILVGASSNVVMLYRNGEVNDISIPLTLEKCAQCYVKFLL